MRQTGGKRKRGNAMKQRSPIMKWCRLALLIVAIIPVFITVAGFAGSLYWPFEVCSHFRLQYACALAVLTVGLGLSRAWIAGAIALVALMLNAYEVGRLYVSTNSAASNADGPALRVV